MNEIMMDGVYVPLPNTDEMEDFIVWANKNKVNEPLSPLHHYDNVSAFRAGINRNEDGHFPDTYKLPLHPTFSIESMYYQPNMKAGYWEGNNYMPIQNILDAPNHIIKNFMRDYKKK